MFYHGNHSTLVEQYTFYFVTFKLVRQSVAQVHLDSVFSHLNTMATHTMVARLIQMTHPNDGAQHWWTILGNMLLDKIGMGIAAALAPFIPTGQPQQVLSSIAYPHLSTRQRPLKIMPANQLGCIHSVDI